MKDFNLITVSVRVPEKDYQSYRKIYGKTFSEFVRASLKTVLNDGRQSFETIFFDKSLINSEVINVD